MALEFLSGALKRVVYTAGASIDSLDDQTWLFWLYPTDFNSSNFRLFYKDGKVQVWVGNSSNESVVAYNRARATSNSSSATVNGTLSLNAWQFIGFTDTDGGGSAAGCLIYHGDLSTLVSEASYSYQDNSNGLRTDDSGSDLWVGGRHNAATNSRTRIAYFWLYNRVLSLGEIKIHQFQPSMILSGCVRKGAFGFDGTNSVPDLSGNGGNGSVTSATVVDHVPLGPLFGFDVNRYYMLLAAGPWPHNPLGHPLVGALGGPV